MTLKLQSLRRSSLSFHMIAWALFIAYETVSVYLLSGSFGHLIVYLLFYSLNIGLFYFNAHVLLKKTVAHYGRFHYIAIVMIVLELAIYLGIKYSLDRALMHLPGLPHPPIIMDKYLIINLWRGAFFTGISTLYWFALQMISYRRQAMETENRYYYSLMEKAKVEQTLAETQNAYLQQQINPHFLFNALNLIYNSFYKFSAPAAFCVGKLADIMRYSFDEVNADGKAPLSLEIEQIQNLIEINRLRYRYPIYIQLDVQGPIRDQRILPLVLLSFTENMFKHGNLKEVEYPALLSIRLNDVNQLTFVTKNLKMNRSPSLRKHHIGLSNAVKRLKYTYLENYRLSIIDEEDTFGIELYINL